MRCGVVRVRGVSGVRAHVSSSSEDEDKKARGKKIYSSEGMFLGYENDFKKKEVSDEDKERIEAERRNNNAALAQGVCMRGREGKGGREAGRARASEPERSRGLPQECRPGPR